MHTPHRLRALWRNLTSRHRFERDLDAELRAFQDLLEDEKLRSGSSETTAHREALLEMQGIEQVKEEVRAVRAGATLEIFFTEVRQSFRALRRSPASSFSIIAILALGMSASTIIFSVFQSILLKPLPFQDAQRVVEITESHVARGIESNAFTEANFWDLRAANRSFEELAAYHYDDFTLTGSGAPEKITGAPVTAGFFRTLGVSPILGRDFAYDEDRGGNPQFWNGRPVALLGYRFWTTHFAADPHVTGRTLRLNAQSYTVIGVLPPGELWVDRDIYIPFGYRPDANRGSWEYSVVGKLAHGVSLQAARADLNRIASALAAAYPREDQGLGFVVKPSSAWIATDGTRRALWALLAAVASLLAIACLNITSLLLARGLSRRREIAVRTALGAGRARLVRYVMIESLLLSAFGAAIGIGGAYLLVPVIRTLEIRGVPRLAEASLNPWVLAFAAAVAVLTGLLAGLAPALQAPRKAIAQALHAGDRQAGARGQQSLRTILVTAEVALSFVLLVGAGLLIRSFTQLTKTNLGFQTENRLLFSLSYPDSYNQHGAGKQFLDRFFARLAAQPGVIAAGAISSRPLEASNPGMSIEAASATRSNTPAPWASWRVVTPNYLHAAGLPLIAGRPLDENDKPVWSRPGEPPPQRRVMISQRLAKRLFPNNDPIGRQVTLWKSQSNLPAEIVGVVADSRERGPAAEDALIVYLPSGANALPDDFVVHTSTPPLSLAPAVRSIVSSLDPDLPVADVRSFEELVSKSVAPQRFTAILLAVFSGFALLLATMGLYSVLSFTVNRRAAEIGLRVALGATSRDIMRMTVGQGLAPALLGIAFGATGAWWLSRFIGTLLYEVKPFDAITYAAVALLVLLTAAAGCYLPGRRAVRTDPTAALRLE